MIRTEITGNVPYKHEQLSLRCEWDQCEFLSDDVPAYYQHVRKHLDDDLDLIESNSCPWRDCTASVRSSKESRTHIFYHAFHTKVKCHGQNLLERQKTEQHCMLGKQTRNLIPDTPELFECQWKECDSSFENPEAFYEHVSYHADELYSKEHASAAAQQCGWNSCDARFATIYKMREHFRTHTQEKKLACPDCGGMFASRTKLLDHFARQDEQPSLNCSYCTRSFSSERLLRDHMRNHINQYKCPLCDMTCRTPSAVKYHMQWRHSKQRPYVCDQCDYAAKHAGDLRKHLEWHVTDKSEAGKSCPYVGCDFATRSSYLLRGHIRTEHLKYPKNVYMCHICQKQYAKGNTLSRHLVSEHRFQWPSGHTRFTYCCNKDNIFTLQTVRYESIELAEAAIAEDAEMDDASGSPEVLSSAPVVLVGADGVPGETSAQPVKLVQIVQRKEDGSTVVQMAQVVAEQGSFGFTEGLQAQNTPCEAPAASEAPASEAPASASS